MLAQPDCSCTIGVFVREFYVDLLAFVSETVRVRIVDRSPCEESSAEFVNCLEVLCGGRG